MPNGVSSKSTDMLKCEYQVSVKRLSLIVVPREQKTNHAKNGAKTERLLGIQEHIFPAKARTNPIAKMAGVSKYKCSIASGIFCYEMLLEVRNLELMMIDN